MTYGGEVLIAVVGGFLAFTQAMVLFTLADMRNRIMRLETGQMKAAQLAGERRHD